MHALLVGALTAAGLTMVPASTVAAGTVAVPGFPGGTSVTLTFKDFQWFDTEGCQYATVTTSVSGVAVTAWSAWGDITYQKDGSSAANFYTEGSNASFVDETAFQLCPDVHKNGVYQVTGDVSITTSPSEVGLWVSQPFPPVTTPATPPPTFTVSGMPTATTIAVPTVIGSLTAFSGKVLASSSKFGAIGADRTGLVTIEVLAGSNWSPLASATLDRSGAYVLTVPSSMEPGLQFRASYSGTNTCGASTSAPTTIPAPPLPSPKVSAKAVRGSSKLFVNVNPNKGRKYWTFQVQRKNADGTWKPLKTYRTQGSKETRTVNLPKGTYRVWVNPKFGYQGAFSSSEVTLKK
jgi:hypothetical protein